MSQTTAPLNQIPNEPTLMDLLDLMRRDLLLNLNCHHIGTVQSFDSSRQTAQATINYQKTFYELDSETLVYHPVQISYPVLMDCPVICLGGGPTSLTFPISQGDECVILFNDRDLDNWFNGPKGASVGVATPRLHSFSDGLILVGVRSLANVLSNYDTSRAVLQNGSTMIGVGASKVKIANAANGSLGIAMTTFLTAIQTFMSACSGSPDSTLSGAASAFSSAAATAISNIEGVLE